MPSISQVTSLRTNINSFGGKVVSLPGTNRVRERVASSNLGGFGDNSVSKFYKDLSEFNQYRYAKICVTSTGILEEYVKKFRSNASDLVTITKDGEEIEESKKINELLRAIKFEKVFFGDKLNEYIYFGSELLLIKVPKSGEIVDAEIENLKYAFSSILFCTKDKDEIYVNGERIELIHDDFYYIPLRIGKLDLDLDEDGGGGYSYRFGNLIQEYQWKASQPLFHGLVTELKLFILKDILTKLIQIQDIVSPNLLLANVDKSTSEEKATELSEEIEKLINQYGDLTQLIASTADVNTLSQFILNNVRVYPDQNGVIKNTDKFDFSRLTGKNQEVRNELDGEETQLVNAIGIPIELYRGNATNKYDALKNSDRLLARVVDEMTTIDDSLIAFVIDYLSSIGKYETGIKVESNLFDYSFVNGINSTYKHETSTQYLRSLSQFALDIKGTLETTSDIFDADKLYKYMTNNAELVYPGFKDLIRKDFLDNLKKSEQERKSELNDL